MHLNIDWQAVDTVLLIWTARCLISPLITISGKSWSRKHTVNSRGSPAEAQEFIRSQYSAVQHTLNWYCLDYWSERLGLDICAMTTAGAHAPYCATIRSRSGCAESLR